MLSLLLSGLTSLVLGAVAFLASCVTSDTVAGTAFVPAAENASLFLRKRAQLEERRQRQVGGAPPSQLQHQLVVACAAADADAELNRRRVQLCKYFLASAIAALAAAVAAWDLWPVRWLMRVYCVTIAACGVVKGPADALRADYLAIPLLLAPWWVVVDFLVLS
jgi:hypothetical protein